MNTPEHQSKYENFAEISMTRRTSQSRFHLLEGDHLSPALIAPDPTGSRPADGHAPRSLQHLVLTSRNTFRDRGHTMSPLLAWPIGGPWAKPKIDELNQWLCWLRSWKWIGARTGSAVRRRRRHCRRTAPGVEVSLLT